MSLHTVGCFLGSRVSSTLHRADHISHSWDLLLARQSKVDVKVGHSGMWVRRQWLPGMHTLATGMVKRWRVPYELPMGLALMPASHSGVFLLMNHHRYTQTPSIQYRTNQDSKAFRFFSRKPTMLRCSGGPCVHPSQSRMPVLLCSPCGTEGHPVRTCSHTPWVQVGGAAQASYLSLKPRITFWRRMTLSVMALSLSTSSSMSWWSWKAELLSSVPQGFSTQAPTPNLTQPNPSLSSCVQA